MPKINASIVISHVVGWLIFLSLPVLFIVGQSGYERSVSMIFSPNYLVLVACYCTIFYLHTYLLFPDFFLKKRYIVYFSVMILMVVAVYFLRPFDNMFSEINNMARKPPQDLFPRGPGPGAGFGERPPGPRGSRGRHNNFDIISIVLFILTIALSIAIVTTQRWRSTEQRAARAETEKANAELSFLKAQINPHFLFNTLNNIYSLAVTQQTNTAPSILKLSNILRYVTDEISEDYVSLSDEVNCIKDYIDLQQLRLGEKTNVVFTVNGDLEYRKIPPLVLMTFIENAFKYGVSNREKSEIRIEIWVEKEMIRFYCSNNIFETKGNTERAGIGISNTKQRLEYLYAGRYDLNIESANGKFTVDLSIRN